ncbi:hypothetical protein BH24CHL5_BH24CHL5_07510 [soil metagenome]
MSPIARSLLLALAAAALLACSPGVPPTASPAPTGSPPPASPTGAPSASPTAGPSHTAQPSPAPGTPTVAYIATFDVEGEEYRILLTDPVDIAIAQDLLAGEGGPTIPNGLIVYGDPGVNTDWSWHIDPESLEFADLTMEVCDGLPSDVEDGTLTSERYCPWGAALVELDPAP